MTIAEALRRFRKEFRLSQRDVANALGVTPQTYQVYERDVMPSAKVLRKIAESFGVTMDYLAGLSDVPRPPDTATLLAAINGAQKLLNDALDGRTE